MFLHHRLDDYNWKKNASLRTRNDSVGARGTTSDEIEPDLGIINSLRAPSSRRRCVVEIFSPM